MKPRKPNQFEGFKLNIDNVDDNTQKQDPIDDIDDAVNQTQKLSAQKLQHLNLEREKTKRENSVDSFILLYIPNALEPIELSNVTRISLGRSTKYVEGEPMIDLNPYQAKLLGVSRFHAEIVYRDEAYYVNDLKSTNGTWVNHDLVTPGQLYQLQDGDTLRMGNFVIQIGLA